MLESEALRRSNVIFEHRYPNRLQGNKCEEYSGILMLVCQNVNVLFSHLMHSQLYIVLLFLFHILYITDITKRIHSFHLVCL